MNKSTFNLFKDLFSNSLAADLAEFMSGIISSLNTLVTGQVGVWINIFIVIAASLLIIYFFMNLASDVSREMLSLEKLILYFIRLFLGFVILLYLKDIILSIMNLCYAVYNYVAGQLKYTDMTGVTFFGVNLSQIDTLEYTGEIKTSMDAAFPFGLSKIFEMMSTMVMSLILMLATKVIQIAAYFTCISSSIIMVVRIIFAPLAVVQCFDPLQHNKGIDYLKKILATGLSFSIIVGVLYAASSFQSTFMLQIITDLKGSSGSGTINIDGDTIRLIMDSSGSVLAKLIVCQFAGIGGLLSANKIANDVVGTH